MIKVSEIKSTDWQLSTTAIGNAVQGVEDVNQCIATIVCTIPGSDPLRPLFGCGLFELMDRPANFAAGVMAQRIADAVKIYEKRINVTKITFTIVETVIAFNLEWVYKNGLVGGQSSLIVGLYDSIVKSPIFEDLNPYLSAVLSTEAYNALVTQSNNFIKV